MAEIPERKYVKVVRGGIGFTVPEEEVSRYKRAGYLEDGETPDESQMTDAELRMAQIAAGEEPTNQVSSLAIENADIPATAGEIATVVNYGSAPGAGPNVPGPAAAKTAKSSSKSAKSSRDGEDEVDEGEDEYDGMVVTELKDEAREREIPGYSSMSRAELLEALRE